MISLLEINSASLISKQPAISTENSIYMCHHSDKTTKCLHNHQNNINNKNLEKKKGWRRLDSQKEGKQKTKKHAAPGIR